MTMPELLALAQRMTRLEALDAALAPVARAEIAFPAEDTARTGNQRVVSLVFNSEGEARQFLATATAVVG